MRLPCLNRFCLLRAGGIVSRWSHKPVEVGAIPTHRIQFYPSVAQPGSASGLGPEGRWFESSYSDQFARFGVEK